MNKNQEKIVSAQSIANDLIAEVTAMLNQDNINKETITKLKDRIQDLAEELGSIETEKLDF